MDVVAIFMQSIASEECRPLPRAAQRELLAAAQAGDQQARNRLARSMLRYVTQWAQRYSRRGLPLLDLVQVGSLGVMRAIEKFDLARQCAFSTYATFWIRQMMQRAVTTSQVVCAGVDGPRPGTELKRTRSLSDADLRRGVEQSMLVTEEPAIVSIDLSSRVQAAIDTLPQRQQTIVRGRMKGQTQSQLGLECGISKERVRQLEAEAHRSLARTLNHLRYSL